MTDSFAAIRDVTARKDHKCEECSRGITPGERYERAAGVWEGSFWSMKTCAHCAAFRRIISAVDDWFWEGAYGGIGMWVSETGSSAAEVGYGFSKQSRYTPLSLYRWSRQFTTRWHDGTDPIPTVKEKV